MEIYNTLTRKKELFEPRDSAGKKVQMFVCGPTVYDSIHIGNARTFVFFDVVAKYLKYKGYDVNYIQNVTDIDNKIIERAQKEGIDPLEYAKKYSNIFKQDMQALGVTSPEYKNATDHIPEVIKQVQALLDKGSAYIIENDGIYFDLSTFLDYGKLSGRTALIADDAVSRIDDSDKKRNKGDFAIWKFKQHNDPSWTAPFGDGRPGWHIEDTSITDKYFGPQYDIHGGGQDLIFPHHEAEIAQQESASGLKPFVKYWMHAGFLINKSNKMSKSLGNFKTARDLLNGLSKHKAETLRLYFLSAHYHAPLNFDEILVNQSSVAVDRIADFLDKLENVSGSENNSVEEHLKQSTDKFYASMDDDFNAPLAIASIFELIRTVNPLLIKNKISAEQAESLKTFLSTVKDILGIIPTPEKQKIPTEILELVEQREGARTEKDWQKADNIRNQIELKGYTVEDTQFGPMVFIK